ncbi:hypothetical protein [Williamsia sp.]|uniref:hypothetical protein n=1 Tax=Williamsia sp. TaxID=1872085 RepID=UPI002F9439DD
MTSPDDQLDGIFSQIAAQDQVDPAVFNQTLEAAFDYTGPGFEELLPETDATLSDDTDSTTDDPFVADLADDSFTDDSDDSDDSGTDHADYTPADDYTGGDDLLA